MFILYSSARLLVIRLRCSMFDRSTVLSTQQSRPVSRPRSKVQCIGRDGMWGSFQFRVISLCKQTRIAKCNIYVQTDSTRPVCHLIHSSQPSSQPASSVTTVSISLFVVFLYMSCPQTMRILLHVRASTNEDTATRRDGTAARLARIDGLGWRVDE